MNLPDFINVGNVIAAAGFVAGLFGWDRYKVKAKATARGVLELAMALAAAYRSIPTQVKPRLQDVLARQVPGLSGPRAKQVLALAEKLVIQANLYAMADASKKLAATAAKIPAAPKARLK